MSNKILLPWEYRIFAWVRVYLHDVNVDACTIYTESSMHKFVCYIDGSFVKSDILVKYDIRTTAINAIDEAKTSVDKLLIERGFTFIRQEQADKISVLC